MIFEKIRDRLQKKAAYYNAQYESFLNRGILSERAEARFKAYKDAIDIINQVEAEYNNGWIPCSERLSDLEADVLLSLRSLDIYTGFRANTEGCFYVEGEGYVEYDNVLAWQPLPEPYTPKGE